MPTGALGCNNCKGLPPSDALLPTVGCFALSLSIASWYVDVAAVTLFDSGGVTMPVLSNSCCNSNSSAIIRRHHLLIFYMLVTLVAT